ncbi:MAG: DUF2934 domain-containing protein [Gammaproteobacteria bacterium]|nr:DUF2934 domain-containing protein [Gammaproteobacteria bacterium]
MGEDQKDEAGSSDRAGTPVSNSTTKKSVVKKVAKKRATKKAVVKKPAVKKAANPGTATRRRPRAPQGAATTEFSPRERYEMIAKMAYFKAEKRGFEPGWEQQDWLESERAIDEMLTKVR